MKEVYQRLLLVKLPVPGIMFIADFHLVAVIMQWYYNGWQQPQQPCIYKPSQNCVGCKWSINWKTDLEAWSSLGIGKIHDQYTIEKSSSWARIRDLTWSYGQLGGSFWHTVVQSVAWDSAIIPKQRIARTRVGKRSIPVAISREK